MLQIIKEFIYHVSLQSNFDNAKIGNSCKVVNTVVREDAHIMVKCLFQSIDDYRRFRSDFEAITGDNIKVKR